MITTASHQLVRCQSPAQVEAIATRNAVPFTRNAYAASVDLGGVTYWWAA